MLTIRYQSNHKIKQMHYDVKVFTNGEKAIHTTLVKNRDDSCAASAGGTGRAVRANANDADLPYNERASNLLV
jgi:hypothetical protein